MNTILENEKGFCQFCIYQPLNYLNSFQSFCSECKIIFNRDYSVSVYGIFINDYDYMKFSYDAFNNCTIIIFIGAKQEKLKLKVDEKVRYLI